MMRRGVSICMSGRVVAELAVAKQRRRHLLHPHQRSRPVDDCRFRRIFHKVADRRAATAGTPNTAAVFSNCDVGTACEIYQLRKNGHSISCFLGGVMQRVY